MKWYAVGLVLVFSFVPTSHGQPSPLRADELLLLFNKTNKASGELAIQYAETRGVPFDHLIALDVPTTDEVRREIFDNRVVSELRRRMRAKGLDRRIRCLVTLYGVPIRVGPLRNTPRLQARSKSIRSAYDETIKSLNEVIAALDRIGTDPATQDGPTKANPTNTVYAMAQRYGKARDAAIHRLAKSTDPAVRRRGRQELPRLVSAVEGAVAIARRLQIQPGVADKDRAEAERQRDAILARLEAERKQARTLLSAGLDAPERDQARRLIRQHSGLLGLLQHLQTDLNRVDVRETKAAFDSELSLLWWDDDYPRFRWLPNRLKIGVRPASEPVDNPTGPVLMVCRLDGPSPAVVRRIIEASAAVEKRGLRGKVYIDARGLSGNKDAYGVYDRMLLDLADLLKRKTRLSVTLDNRDDLFGPGACPDAALYCGWYSLGKYVDAFDFRPGAVGLHIASYEAISLHKPGTRYWCKELLRDGVAATFGPVAEPYLHAFCDPREFFGLLLTGRFSLVECFYYTKPFNSWMMLLVGDPLYRPFAANPQLTLDDVFGKTVSWPPEPTTRPHNEK